MDNNSITRKQYLAYVFQIASGMVNNETPLGDIANDAISITDGILEKTGFIVEGNGEPVEHNDY